MTFTNTSKEAAESIRNLVVTWRETVRLLIEKRPEQGLTCDEIEVIANMRHQTASARIRELFLAGKIVDSGERRVTRSGRNAVVWKLKESA